MVDINVKLSFNQQESDLLEMAANLGAPQPTDDHLKGILLAAAANYVANFSKGEIRNHYAKVNPPGPHDEERRLRIRREKAERDLARIDSQLTQLKGMRLKPVKS
jgi:hypothetical protein